MSREEEEENEEGENEEGEPGDFSHLRDIKRRIVRLIFENNQSNCENLYAHTHAQAHSHAKAHSHSHAGERWAVHRFAPVNRSGLLFMSFLR